MPGKKPAAQNTRSSTAKQAGVDTGTAFPIVGLGASAGGLEAFETFFKAMPPNSDMAFVLVAHLDPTHASMLPELLQQQTEMPVLPVEDGVVVQPNAVYVIPPNKDLKLFHGALQLMELSHARGTHLPIDSFFRSLAEDQGNNAVAIILSGTGGDGTLGLKAIKGEMGMVMVQDEESAVYDGMPRSAIATNLADYVLPPNKMPAVLIGYVQRTRQGRDGTEHSALATTEPMAGELQKIYALLRAHTRHDFSQYKETTICRRIERRMHVHQLDRVADYVRYLQDSEREMDILFKELLIGVSSFFRDQEALQALEETLLEILGGKPKEYSFRVWVPGCSTGEEAYTLAILLQECMERLKVYFNVQLFGTDIDPDAIDFARTGCYPFSIAADVGEERLQRFFQKQDEGYQIKKAIREAIVFAPQNLIADPPFTKLDLVSCRNLLIYFTAELQNKILPVFHYSLNPDGVLFLGTSETIGQSTDLFATVSKKWKIYRPKPPGALPFKTLAHSAFNSRGRTFGRKTTDPVQQAEETSVLQLAETILKQSSAPTSVLIDSSYDVLYIHGRTGQYLEPAQGRASNNLLEMARPDIKEALTVALREGETHRQEVVKRGLRIENDGHPVFVDLTVRPVLTPTHLHGILMVVFEAVPAAAERSTPKTHGGPQPRGKRQVQELDRELRDTKETLHTTIEEMQTANEELKSTNEELQSTNEELQSTNEELETSREELQSLNEESATVNAELESRVEDLSTANDDLKNLLDSTQIATLFLDIDLRVHRYTPKMTDVIPLTEGDVGRPVTDLASRLQEVDLEGQCKRVLDTLVPEQSQVRGPDQSSFAMRILPYRTVSNTINGVVITLEDITDRQRVEDELRISEERFDLVLKNSKIIVACVDRDLRYTWIRNPRPDFDPSLVVGKRDDELEDSGSARQLLQMKRQVIETGKRAEAEIIYPLSGGDRTCSVIVEPLLNGDGEVIGATTIAVDTTERGTIGEDTSHHG